MELKLQDGRYALSAAGVPESVRGAEETLQRVLMRLTARRGAFWPDPEYGSRLYTLPQLRPSRRAAAAKLFVAEALSDEREARATDVAFLPGRDGGASASVSVTLEAGEQTAKLTIEV